MNVRVGASTVPDRIYALVQGTQTIDPGELPALLPDASWYDEAIVVLAIEPAPQDALPVLLDALTSPGAPASICSAEIIGNEVVVECRPSVTRTGLLLQYIDVEIARYRGYRRTRLLCPLPGEVVAQIAADGLQAPEIAPDRVLEVLLEDARVE